MLNFKEKVFQEPVFKLLVIDNDVYALLNKKCIPFNQWPLEVYEYFRNEMMNNSRMLSRIKSSVPDTEKDFVKHYCIKNSSKYQLITDEQLIKLVHPDMNSV